MVLGYVREAGTAKVIPSGREWEGQVINGNFHLRRYLGGSKHSAVFLTQQQNRELPKTAIKLIPADPARAEIKLCRWRMAAKLSHPHLMQLFDMGRCQLSGMELLFVVMEYAEENLAQILPHRALTSTEAQDMLDPALKALAYIHGKGLVHGHVKPANIMAVADQLKLSSDGLCQIGEANGNLRKPGVYDPPEAVSGTAFPAGDVWSLGVTLTEALTQRLPAWNELTQEDAILPRTLPPPFSDVVRHCLRRNSHQRWTVTDIAARLQGTLAATRNRTTRRSRKGLMAVTVALGLSLAAILVVPRWFDRGLESQKRAPALSPEQPSPMETGKSTQTRSAEKQRSRTLPKPPKSTSSRVGTRANTGLVSQSDILHEVLPVVPQKARDTIRGTVRVSIRVHVDSSGSVVGAEFDSPGPSKYFARLAIQAARDWKFAPSQDPAVLRDWILRFEFKRTTTNVFPAQL